MPPYDVAIIGAGVTGTALAHVLTRYTDVASVALVERYAAVAQVNSKSTANSQTLHFGDIETNYTPEKARRVAQAASRVARYLERTRAAGIGQVCPKMVLGVGADEVALLKRRHEALKPVFPGLVLLDRDGVAAAEPAVVEERDPAVPLAALKAPDGPAVDFGLLSGSFLEDARATAKRVDVSLGRRVGAVERRGGLFRLEPQGIEARTVVAAAGAMSLLFAHRLGYGRDFAILPVAGDFYVAPRSLKGKVYTVQDDSLPFAAVHGDPDLSDPKITRFGPTARVLPLLERGDLGSFWGFLQSTRFDPLLALRAAGLLADPAVRGFALRNALYTVPVLGARAFAAEARKIVPGLAAGDLRPAPWPGGIRPQLIDRRTGRLELGEAKLEGDRILFDVTPSPGASVCLKSAEDDARVLAGWLGKAFDEKSFERDCS
ncbi:MAG: FAD-dependent oxidoreductase [Elusimicrobia bacterium]|nr:FAD-dependent oxidoreductase [Elusimicrobiota bacterium]